MFVLAMLLAGSAAPVLGMAIVNRHAWQAMMSLSLVLLAGAAWASTLVVPGPGSGDAWGILVLAAVICAIIGLRERHKATLHRSSAGREKWSRDDCRAMPDPTDPSHRPH
jgi:hypothetical protein